MKKYLITRANEKSASPDEFKNQLLKKVKKHSPTHILYRDKENDRYEVFAKEFVFILQKFKNIKKYIHQDIDLAKKLQCNGVHLSSTQFNKIKYALSLNLEVIISTHTYEEVLIAKAMGVHYVTYGPIFFTPNKTKPKGVEDLKEIVKISKMNIFALGGIVNDEFINKLKKSCVYGFASIRYFD